MVATPSVRLMTTEEIRRRRARITASARDEEVAHQMEDALWLDVLRAIAHNRCDDPRACAEEAAMTENIAFTRYFA